MSIIRVLEKRLGKIIYQYEKREKPQPITTMVNILRENNIDFKRWELMAYDINTAFEYYLKYKSFIEKLKIEKIVIYGFGKEKKEIPLQEGIIIFLPTTIYLTEHLNLIYDKNEKVYLYYEPYHKDNYDFFINFQTANKEDFDRYAPKLIEPKESLINEIKNLQKL